MIGLSSFHFNEIINDCSIPEKCESDAQFINLNDDFSAQNYYDYTTPREISHLADKLDNMRESSSYIDFSLEKGLKLDADNILDYKLDEITVSKEFVSIFAESEN